MLGGVVNPLHRDDVALAHEQRLPGRLAAGLQRGRLVLRGQTRDVNPEILAVAMARKSRKKQSRRSLQQCARQLHRDLGRRVRPTAGTSSPYAILGRLAIPS